MAFLIVSLQCFSVSKIAEKAVCGSEFLTTWHCILSTELIIRHSCCLAILPTGLALNNMGTSKDVGNSDISRPPPLLTGST